MIKGNNQTFGDIFMQGKIGDANTKPDSIILPD